MTSLSTPTASRSAINFLLFGGLAAVVAALAATTSLALGLLPWAMFVGWVAWFTRPTSRLQGAATWMCVLGGLVLGALASTAVRTLAPDLGVWAMGLVVFFVAMLVLSLRAVRGFDNIPAWFLGMIAFASHAEPGPLPIIALAGSSAIGVFGGWLSQTLQQRWATH